MRYRMLLVTAAVLFSPGCVSVNNAVLTDADAARPVPPMDVEVYFADDSLSQHARAAIERARSRVP